jgi:hypothetical protein
MEGSAYAGRCPALSEPHALAAHRVRTGSAHDACRRADVSRRRSMLWRDADRRLDEAVSETHDGFDLVAGEPQFCAQSADVHVD